MRKCLICGKPITWRGGCGSTVCQCEGERCNLCRQIYQGAAGDCLCTGTAYPVKSAAVLLTTPSGMHFGRLWLLVATALFFLGLGLFGCSDPAPFEAAPEVKAPVVLPDLGRYASHTEVVCSTGGACLTLSVVLEVYTGGTCFWNVAQEAYPHGPGWLLYESDVCVWEVRGGAKLYAVTTGTARSDGVPRGAPGQWAPVFDVVDSGLMFTVYGNRGVDGVDPVEVLLEYVDRCAC